LKAISAAASVLDDGASIDLVTSKIEKVASFVIKFGQGSARTNFKARAASFTFGKSSVGTDLTKPDADVEFKAGDAKISLE